MNINRIAWLAGLLEGEGCFSRRGNCITIQLYVSDRDVIEKAQAIIGAPSIGSRRPKNEKHKTCYYWTVSGPEAAAWMMTLYSLMGSRRQERIKELLTVFKQAKTQHKSTLVCQHIDAYRKGRTVCDRCYQHDWYERKKAGDVQ